MATKYVLDQYTNEGPELVLWGTAPHLLLEFAATNETCTGEYRLRQAALGEILPPEKHQGRTVKVTTRK